MWQTSTKDETRLGGEDDQLEIVQEIEIWLSF